jgi:methionine salvage enolase-phosphatase E1
MKNLILLLAIAMFSQTSFALDANKLLNDYLLVKDALIKSDDKAAKQAVETYLTDIKKEAEFKEKKSLTKAVEKMNKATDLEKRRQAFKEVSVIMWQIVKNANDVKGPVYYQYCPMKKAYWLSREKEIKNPYYGSSMLNCGKVSETKI